MLEKKQQLRTAKVAAGPRQEISNLKKRGELSTGKVYENNSCSIEHEREPERR